MLRVFSVLRGTSSLSHSSLVSRSCFFFSLLYTVRRHFSADGYACVLCCRFHARCATRRRVSDYMSLTSHLEECRFTEQRNTLPYHFCKHTVRQITRFCDTYRFAVCFFTENPLPVSNSCLIRKRFLCYISYIGNMEGFI